MYVSLIHVCCTLVSEIHVSPAMLHVFQYIENYRHTYPHTYVFTYVGTYVYKIHDWYRSWVWQVTAKPPEPFADCLLWTLSKQVAKCADTWEKRIPAVNKREAQTYCYGDMPVCMAAAHRGLSWCYELKLPKTDDGRQLKDIECTICFLPWRSSLSQLLRLMALVCSLTAVFYLLWKSTHATASTSCL